MFQSRQVLAEQLAISRELTQKIKQSTDESEEDEGNHTPLVLSKEDKENPWMNSVKTESEVDKFIHSYRKYWDQKQQEEKKNPKTDDESNSVKKCTLSESKSEKQNSDETSKEGKHLRINIYIYLYFIFDFLYY